MNNKVSNITLMRARTLEFIISLSPAMPAAYSNGSGYERGFHVKSVFKALRGGAGTGSTRGDQRDNPG